jgi:hypothetical protein
VSSASPLELAHQGQAPVGRDHDLERAGLTVAEGVLAGMVDVEPVVRVLDHRHPQARAGAGAG